MEWRKRISEGKVKEEEEELKGTGEEMEREGEKG